MSSTNFATKHTANSIQLLFISANIKNTKSFIMHPASIRCQQMSDAELVQRINKDLIRLSGRVEDRKILKVFTELQA